MALRDTSANAPTSTGPVPDSTVPPAGAFEPMDESQAKTTAANDPAPSAAPTTAAPAALPATQQGGGMVLSNRAEASAFQKEVEEMKGAGDFSYGNYRVFKGIQGSIKETGEGTAKLGRWVKVSMVAWDDRVQISPGTDAATAKDAVAYSKDGITVDSTIGEKFRMYVGRPVTEYLQHLKTDADYPKARVGRFIDVACVVHESEKDAGLAGEIIQVSLSSSSIPSFSAYQEKLNMKAKAAARGIPGIVVPADPFTFFFEAQEANKDGKDWTKLKVTDKLST